MTGSKKLPKGSKNILKRIKNNAEGKVTSQGHRRSIIFLFCSVLCKILLLFLKKNLISNVNFIIQKNRKPKRWKMRENLCVYFSTFSHNNLPLSWMNQVCNLYQPNLNVRFPLTYCGKVEWQQSYLFSIHKTIAKVGRKEGAKHFYV